MEFCTRLIEEVLLRYFVVSLTTSGVEGQAFSADTNLAEVLIVANRKIHDIDGTGHTTFVKSRHRPRTHFQAILVGRHVHEISNSKSEIGKIQLTKQKLNVG